MAKNYTNKSGTPDYFSLDQFTIDYQSIDKVVVYNATQRSEYVEQIAETLDDISSEIGRRITLVPENDGTTFASRDLYYKFLHYLSSPYDETQAHKWMFQQGVMNPTHLPDLVDGSIIKMMVSPKPIKFGYAYSSNHFSNRGHVSNYITIASGYHEPIQSGTAMAGFKELVAHEMGHALGAVPDTRSKIDRRLGNHCCNPGCVMQFVSTVQEARDRNRARELYFCLECRMDIR